MTFRLRVVWLFLSTPLHAGQSCLEQGAECTPDDLIATSLKVSLLQRLHSAPAEKDFSAAQARRAGIIKDLQEIDQQLSGPCEPDDHCSMEGDECKCCSNFGCDVEPLCRCADAPASTPLIQTGRIYRFSNNRYGMKSCLDRGTRNGGTSIESNPCDSLSRDEWHAGASGPGDDVFTFTNYRPGYDAACLDRHTEQAAVEGNVAAYPCTFDGGDSWKVTYSGKMVRLTNSRFNAPLCLDRNSKKEGAGSVYANNCDDNGGDDWEVEDLGTPQIGVPCAGCQNGYGMWGLYPPDDSTAFACLCETCKEGYQLVDMFCQKT